jgi:hypothetical protein
MRKRLSNTAFIMTMREGYNGNEGEIIEHDIYNGNE